MQDIVTGLGPKLGASDLVTTIIGKCTANKGKGYKEIQALLIVDFKLSCHLKWYATN